MCLVNCIFVGTHYFEMKRKALNRIGYDIGDNSKVVGPIECTGTLKNRKCWIEKNLIINENGLVIIGDNCDIAPEVTFHTGGHEMGTCKRRAGEGKSFSQIVGNGVWIGGRSTIQGNIKIEDGAVVAGCSCVTKNVAANTLEGGVPAQAIRRLEQ